MDHELEVIRDRMEETRSSLANKLETLETQVRETVEGASEAVTSTVEGVKEVVDTVSETLDFGAYIKKHPWVAVGTAVAAGFCVAQIMGPSREAEPQQKPAPPSPPAPGPHRNGSHQETAAEKTQDEEDWTAALGSVWETATGTIQGLAVGTLMSFVRDLVTQSLPEEWKGDLGRMVDDVTTQLGGRPQPQTNGHEPAVESQQPAQIGSR